MQLNYSNSDKRSRTTTVYLLFPFFILLLLIGLLPVSGCSQPSRAVQSLNASPDEFEYVLGPGDEVDIFVWRNSDLTVNGIPVRPDGKISAPLVDDLTASGKTPKQLARDIEQQLAKYIKDPFVTITVRQFHGRLIDQVRVVGEAATPRALPYTKNMTLLDVMIAVGGLTEFAAGNRASVIRTTNGKQQQINVRLKSLLKDGDINANMVMLPGDVVIIPESWF